MRSAVALTLLLLFAQAPKGITWQDGTLTTITKRDPRMVILEHQMQTGTGDYAVRYSATYEYTIETSDHIYVAQLEVFQMGAPVSPPVDLNTGNNAKPNIRVSFAVEKSKLYLKDKDGKEVRLELKKQSSRPAAAPF